METQLVTHTYLCIFNFQSATARVDIRSIQRGFGPLGTLDRIKRGTFKLRPKEMFKYDVTTQCYPAVESL